MKLEYWIIRHKPTGNIIPYAHGKMGRGGSHVEPCNPSFDRPRLFLEERTAKGFLTSWLKGKVTVSPSQDYYGEYNEDWTITKVESRKREDMEIIKASLVF